MSRHKTMTLEDIQDQLGVDNPHDAAIVAGARVLSSPEYQLMCELSRNIWQRGIGSPTSIVPSVMEWAAKDMEPHALHARWVELIEQGVATEGMPY